MLKSVDQVIGRSFWSPGSLCPEQKESWALAVCTHEHARQPHRAGAPIHARGGERNKQERVGWFCQINS